MHSLRRHRSAVSFGAAFLMIARLLVVVAATGLLAVQSAAPASAEPTPGVCITIADSGGGNGGDDLLTIVDRMNFNASTNETNVGTGTGTYSIEAIARDSAGVMYATNNDQLGTINLTTGVFSTGGRSPMGTGTGAQGSVNFGDVDGLSFDPFTGLLYGAERQTGLDLLVVINPATGQVVEDFFGPNVDYVEIPAQAGFRDIDDIAIDPFGGTMYAVANNGGSGDHLVRIDKTTGATTDLGEIGADDVEGLGFSDTGQLWGTTGTAPLGLYPIDKTGGGFPLSGTIRPLNNGADYESVDCRTPVPAGINTITGTVFGDVDQDTLYGPSDFPDPGAVVRLYLDVNNNGVVDSGDVLVDTATTAGDGTYSFEFNAVGDFVLSVDPSSLPSGHTMTTDSVESASFATVGNTDPGNDFGWYVASPLTITKDVDPIGEVAPGQVLTYTLTAANLDSINHTGITVTDAVPAGTTYVSGSSQVTAPTVTGAVTFRDEFPIDNSYAGNNSTPPGTNWSGSWVEEGESDGAGSGRVEVRDDSPPGTSYAARIERAGYGLLRQANLAGSTSATLSFDIRRESVRNSVLIVEMGSSASGPWAEVARFTGGNNGTTTVTDSSYASYTFAVPPAALTANANVRFRETTANDNFYIDNVAIEAVARSVTTFAGTPPPNVATGLELRPTETATITFQVTVDSLPGTPSIDNLASVSSTQSPIPATDTATNDVEVSIDVTKTANPTTLPEPGGDVAYTIDIVNTSGIAVTISDLDDDVFGDLLDAGNAAVSSNTCASMNLVIPPAQPRSCTFDAALVGEPPATHVNTVTATAGNPGHGSDTDTDDETVTFTNVPPVIDVTKTANPTSAS